MPPKQGLSFCILCLCSGRNLMDIYSTFYSDKSSIHDLLRDFLQFNVFEDDCIPWLICHTCVIRLSEFQEFKKRCLRSILTLYSVINPREDGFTQFTVQSPKTVHKKDVEPGGESLLDTTRERDGFSLTVGNVNIAESTSDDIVYPKDGSKREHLEGDTSYFNEDNGTVDISPEYLSCTNCGGEFLSVKDLRAHNNLCRIIGRKDLSCEGTNGESDVEVEDVTCRSNSFDPTLCCARCGRIFKSKRRLVRHIEKYDFKCSRKKELEASKNLDVVHRARELSSRCRRNTANEPQDCVSSTVLNLEEKVCAFHNVPPATKRIRIETNKENMSHGTSVPKEQQEINQPTNSKSVPKEQQEVNQNNVGISQEDEVDSCPASTNISGQNVPVEEKRLTSQEAHDFCNNIFPLGKHFTDDSITSDEITILGEYNSYTSQDTLYMTTGDFLNKDANTSPTPSVILIPNEKSKSNKPDKPLPSFAEKQLGKTDGFHSTDLRAEENPQSGCYVDTEESVLLSSSDIEIIGPNQTEEGIYYVCNDCGKPLKCKSALRRHIVNCHLSLLRLKCSVCHEQFSNADDLKEHCGLHPADLKFYCTVCRDSFQTKFILNEHAKQKHGVAKAFVCSICSNGFISKFDLGTHQALVHADSEKPFKCTACGKSYVSLKGCNDHMNICLRKIVSYQCNVCGKVATTKTNLQLHSTVHSKEKNFPCSICSKRYTSVMGRNTHIRSIHLKLRPYECGICKKKFATKGRLKEHYISHSDARPFSCPVCAKCFKEKKKVRMHLQTVHGKPRNKIFI